MKRQKAKNDEARILPFSGSVKNLLIACHSERSEESRSENMALTTFLPHWLARSSIFAF